MTKGTQKEDLELKDVYDRFYYSLYGCNQCLRQLLDKYLRFSPAYFFEYLGHVPLPYIGGASEGKVREAMKDVYLLSPFARRMIEQSPIIPGAPDADGNIKMAFRTRNLQRHEMMRFAMGCSLVAKALYRQWNGLGPRHYDSPGLCIHTWDSCQSDFTRGMQPERFCYGLMHKFRPADVAKTYASAQTEKGSLTSLNVLQVLLNIAFPMEMGNHLLSGLLLPIASDKYFYGCIWMLLPGLNNGQVESDVSARIGGPTAIAKPAAEVGDCSAKSKAKEDTKCECNGNGALPDCEKQRDELLKHSPDEIAAPMPHLMAKLLGVVHEHYLPVLALQHEQLCETILNVNETSKLLAGIDGSALNPKLQRVFAIVPECKGHGIPHKIEERLVELEKKRAAKRTQLSGATEPERSRLTEDLQKLDVFKKYTVCSREMVDLLIKVVSAAKPLRASGSSLHALLIVGGPGTGKQSLANILAAFSESYAFGKRYTVNMAALKPGPVVPFAISGLKFEGGRQRGDQKQRFEIALVGILASVRNARISDLRHANIWNVKGKRKISMWYRDLAKRHDFPMLVLDELNSMDQDSQGVLLRFLENAEVVPIGGTVDPLDIDPATGAESRERKDVRVRLSNFLVVGMMNEDPEAISREEAMEFVTESKYLRGIVSDMLYEHVLKLRRMRPDIKYRMVRAGKLEIPLLRDRREDLPFLFYIYLNDHAKDKITDVPHTGGDASAGHPTTGGHNNGKKPNFQITLDALALLVSDALRWPGNIRQLQALAAKVAVTASDDPKAIEGDTCWVDKDHVERGMAEIGMTPKKANPE